MASKKYKEQTKRSGPQGRQKSVQHPAHRPFRRGWLAISLIGIGAVVLVFGQFAARRDGSRPGKEQGVNRQERAAGEQATANADPVSIDYGKGDAAWDPSWPSLPTSGQPARPVEVVRAMYAYAARRGDVLEYMPCYCGCEEQGHRSNRDCFVRGKTPAGVPQWDPMGYT